MKKISNELGKESREVGKDRSRKESREVGKDHKGVHG